MAGDELSKALEGAGKDLSHVGSDVAKAGDHVVSDSASALSGETLVDPAKEVVDLANAKKAAGELGKLLEDAQPWLQHGFRVSGVGSVGDHFAQATQEIFRKYLGKDLGEVEAAKLGRKFGDAFVEHWGTAGAEHDAVRDALHKVLIAADRGADPGLSALAEKLPFLARELPQANRLFHVGYAIGEQLKGGLQNNLTEGFYNLFFSDSHQFSSSFETFFSGIAMGLLGRALHHLAAPVMHWYTHWAQSRQWDPVYEDEGRYLKLTHPLSVLSLISNALGHPAPFLVPALGPRMEGPRPTTPGGFAVKPLVRLEGLGSSKDEGAGHRPATTSRTDLEPARRPVRVPTVGDTATAQVGGTKWPGPVTRTDPHDVFSALVQHATGAEPSALGKRTRDELDAGNQPDLGPDRSPKAPGLSADGLPPAPHSPFGEDTPSYRFEPIDSFLSHFSGDGYAERDAAAQQRLEDALETGGGPQRFGHPREWVKLLNEPGDGDPLRFKNCAVAAMAFHATFHGAPEIAPRPRTTPLDGHAAVQEWTKTPAEFMGRGTDALKEVAKRIERGGGGSDALVFTWHEDGTAHVLNLVNVPGHGLVWVDAQRGEYSPVDRPLRSDVTRVWAIPLDAGNRHIPATGSEGPHGAAARELRETEVPPIRPAEAFYGDTGTGSSSGALPVGGDDAFGAPGRKVNAPGDGLCLLSSVALTDPAAVHAAIRAWGVRHDSGADLRTTGEALKRTVRDYLRSTPPDRLPSEIVRNYRAQTVGDQRRALNGMPRGTLLNQLRLLHVDHVTNHEVVPAKVMRRHFVDAKVRELTARGAGPADARRQAEAMVRWKFKGPQELTDARQHLRRKGIEPPADTERLRTLYLHSLAEDHLAEYGGTRQAARQWAEEQVGWNFADDAVPPREQWRYLNDPAVDEHIRLEELSDGDLADLLVWHRAQADTPMTEAERQGLLSAVENWERTWAEGTGEMFPPALAHALGLRLRIVVPDAGGAVNTRAIVGPVDGHKVTVYHNGHNHYDASEPVPEAKPPASAVVPPLPSVPSTGSESVPVPPPHTTPLPATPESDRHPSAHPTPESASHPAPSSGGDSGSHPPEPPSRPLPPIPESAPHPVPPVLRVPVDPAFAPKATLEPGDLRRPPARVSVRRQLAASDLFVGLHHDDIDVARALTEQLTTALGRDFPSGRTIAESFFDPATLRPKLATLSRGDVWEAPIEDNGFSGHVSIRVSVEELHHQSTAEKVEFENGSERQAAIGNLDESRQRFNAGLQTKFKAGKAEFNEALGFQYDDMHADVRVDAGRIIARGKTVEPGAIFATRLRVTLDFGELTYEGKPFETSDGATTRDVEIGATVGIPVRDTLGANGLPAPVKDLFQVPERVERDRRLGSSDIVIDVSADRPHPVTGATADDRPMEIVLSDVAEQGKATAGSLWPKLHERMLDELDLVRLQQDLKSLMSGEKIRIEVFSDDGLSSASAEISASVESMRQTGTTPQTEFNVGTGVQRVVSGQDTESHGVQVPVLGQIGGGADKSSNGSVNATAQFIRDKVHVTGTGVELTTTTKTKAPGAVFDGRAALHVEFSHSSPMSSTKHGQADTTVTFRTIIEQAEARKLPPADVHPPMADPTLFVAGEQPPPPTRRTFAAGTEIHSPPDRVWQSGRDGGGLSDTVTVRDVPDIRPLHDGLEQEGRRLLGNAWEDVKDEVRQAFSLPMVASRLTTMTRGLPLEAPELTAGLLRHHVKIAATARVVEMGYKRHEGKAEANPVDESTTFSSDRYLLSDTRTGQVQGSGIAQLDAAKDTLEVGASYSRQARNRHGWRDGSSGKVYANGKFPRPQDLFDSRVELDVTVTVDGQEHTLKVPLEAELSLESRDTRTYQVGEDGLGVFDGPGKGVPQAPKPPDELHDPPTAITRRGALGASDVVHSLGKGDTAVVLSIQGTLERQFGDVPDNVRMRMQERFDPVALKSQLSRLTRGGVIKEKVSIHGWEGTITVRAGLRKDFTHTETVKAFEFEQGSQVRTMIGVGKDVRVRKIFGLPFKAKLPHFDLGWNLTHRLDRVSGFAVDTVGATVSKAKTVEPAGLFEGTADFTVHFDIKRLGQRMRQPDLTFPVEATVGVPLRNAPLHGSHEVAPVKDPKGPPSRVVETHRLGSSDLITDVHHLAPTVGGKPHEELASVTRTLGPLSGIGKRVLGSDWPGMRRKIRDELDLVKLQPQLKAMMAGHEVVVRHGRSTVRISAAVSRLGQKPGGETPQTEFNTGTRVQRSFATQDGVTTYGAGRGENVTVSGLGTTNPLPVGVAAVVGGSGSYAWGHDLLDVQAHRTAAGTATKAKVPGTVFDGVATLVFTLEHRPLIQLGDRNRIVPEPAPRPGAHPTAGDRMVTVPGRAWRAVKRLGTSTHAIGTAKIGFEAVIETSETVKGAGAKPFDAPEHRQPRSRAVPSEPPREMPVRVPPARIWNEGVRDIDVMRWLGDSSGVQDILKNNGPGFFGHRTWARMERMATSTVDHSQLASRFGPATRGEEISTPDPGPRFAVKGGGVEVSLKVLQLEYDRTDGKVELSPSNETSTASTQTRLDWSLWAGQVQGGVKGEVGSAEGTFQAVLGAQHRDRHGLSQGNTGKAMSHAKFGTPMARYNGFAEVSVRFFKDGRELTEKGVIPVTLDIPERETGEAKVLSDRYLAFSRDDQAGREYLLDRSLPNEGETVAPEPDGLWQWKNLPAEPPSEALPTHLPDGGAAPGTDGSPAAPHSSRPPVPTRPLPPLPGDAPGVGGDGGSGTGTSGAARPAAPDKPLPPPPVPPRRAPQSVPTVSDGPAVPVPPRRTPPPVPPRPHHRPAVGVSVPEGPSPLVPGAAEDLQPLPVLSLADTIERELAGMLE